MHDDAAAHVPNYTKQPEEKLPALCLLCLHGLSLLFYCSYSSTPLSAILGLMNTTTASLPVP